MNTIPIHEMRHDLEVTDRDLTRLNAILENLHLFIHDSDGEDRSFLKVNVRTFENLVSRATRLRETIIMRLSAAVNADPGVLRTEIVVSAGVSPATPGTQDFPAFDGIKVNEIDPLNTATAVLEAQSGLMATPKTLPPQ